mgnify:CR=1 FL=1
MQAAQDSNAIFFVQLHQIFHNRVGGGRVKTGNRLVGVLFGAVHAGGSDAAFLVPLAVLGVLFCLLYERTGSLYPPIVLHAINNSIAFTLLVTDTI